MACDSYSYFELIGFILKTFSLVFTSLLQLKTRGFKLLL